MRVVSCLAVSFVKARPLYVIVSGLRTTYCYVAYLKENLIFTIFEKLKVVQKSLKKSMQGLWVVVRAY